MAKRNRGDRTAENTNYYFRNRERLLQRQKDYSADPEKKAHNKEYQKKYYQKVKVKKELARLKKLQEDLKTRPEILALLAKEDDPNFVQKPDWKSEPDIDWESLEFSEEEDQRGKSKHQRIGGKGARPPRPYYVTTKYLDEDEFAISSYAKNKLNTICPLGFFQRPEGENPFVLRFD